MKGDARVPVLLMARELGIGGTERQVAETAKRLDRDRFVPYVACFHSQGMRADELHEQGIPVIELPVRSFLSSSALVGVREMGRVIAARQIRIVHTFDVPLNLFGVPAARLFRVPIVMSSQRAFRVLVSPVFRRALRVTDRLSTAIVVNCRAVRDHLRLEYGVPEEKIRLCYNGVDTSVFFPGPRESGRPVVIGGVYALREEKGLDILIDAFAELHRRVPDTRLLIVGSGYMEGELKRRAADRGLGESCRFEANSPNPAAHLRAIDIFVLPSRSEALSNSLLEAMACGCAAVASKVGGNPELVEAGESGLLFESGNVADLAGKLELLAGDATLRWRLGEAAAERARRNFNVSRLGQEMSDLYQEMIETSGGRQR